MKFIDRALASFAENIGEGKRWSGRTQSRESRSPEQLQRERPLAGHARFECIHAATLPGLGGRRVRHRATSAEEGCDACCQGSGNPIRVRLRTVVVMSGNAKWRTLDPSGEPHRRRSGAVTRSSTHAGRGRPLSRDRRQRGDARHPAARPDAIPHLG
jgi:hypothetical protein